MSSNDVDVVAEAESMLAAMKESDRAVIRHPFTAAPRLIRALRDRLVAVEAVLETSHYRLLTIPCTDCGGSLVWSKREQGSLCPRCLHLFESRCLDFGVIEPDDIQTLRQQLATVEAEKQALIETLQIIRAQQKDDFARAETAEAALATTETNLPPSLGASLDLFREDPEGWHREQQRTHNFKVTLIQRAETAAAALKNLSSAHDSLEEQHNLLWRKRDDLERKLAESTRRREAGRELIALVLEMINKDGPNENSEYCWFCGTDVNGKIEPFIKQPHLPDCWMVRVHAVLSLPRTGQTPQGTPSKHLPSHLQSHADGQDGPA